MTREGSQHRDDTRDLQPNHYVFNPATGSMTGFALDGFVYQMAAWAEALAMSVMTDGRHRILFWERGETP